METLGDSLNRVFDKISLEETDQKIAFQNDSYTIKVTDNQGAVMVVVEVSDYTEFASAPAHNMSSLGSEFEAVEKEIMESARQTFGIDSLSSFELRDENGKQLIYTNEIPY